MDKKIQERLRRLKAMAEDASSENEAMIAARRLHALLARYGVSENDIGDEDAVIESDINTMVVRGKWCRIVLGNVAALYFCRSIVRRGRARGGKIAYTLVGQPVHIDAAMTVIRSVIRAVQIEAGRSSKVNRPPHTPAASWITSFCNGAASRIAERCQEMIEAGRRGTLEDGDGNQLPVLASLYDSAKDANAAFVAGRGLKPGRTVMRSRDQRAQHNGAAFAEGVSLGNEIGKHAPAFLSGPTA